MLCSLRGFKGLLSTPYFLAQQPERGVAAPIASNVATLGDGEHESSQAIGLAFGATSDGIRRGCVAHGLRREFERHVGCGSGPNGSGPNGSGDADTERLLHE
jgi:hypothetical protein